MKKTLLSFLILSSATVFASDRAPTKAASDKSTNIRTNALAPFAGALVFAADFATSDQLTIGPRLGGASRTVDGTNKYSVGGIGFDVVFYLGHNHLTDGWYVSPFLDLLNLTVTNNNGASTKLGGSEIGVAAGYQWVWSGGFNLGLDLAVGEYNFPGTVTLPDANGNPTTINNNISNAFLYPQCWLGYAW